MKILKVLIPKFLTQFDNFLLLNYPHVWHTRVHYVVFYGLLSWLLLFAVGYCYPLSMYDISMDLSKVDEIKKVSSWFLWICGFFAGVFWWQKVAQFRILLGKWSHALVECGLFFVGISVIWQAMNAFKNGIEVNIAYRVSSPITQQDKQRLYERNFYMPMYLAYRTDVRQYDNISPSIFSLNRYQLDEALLKKHFSIGENNLSKFIKRLNQDEIGRDSQFSTTNRYWGENKYDHTSNASYDTWVDSINSKIRKYIKPYFGREEFWDEERSRFYTKKVLIYPSFRLLQDIDSIYQLMTETDRTELEEIKFRNIQEELDASNKKPNFMPMNYISSLLKRDFDAIIDSFPLHVFRNNNANYMCFLKYANKLFEKDFRIQQIEANFNKDEEKALRNYMIELILMQPLYDGFSTLPLEDLEIGLFYQKDSLITNFLSQLSPKSRKAYENWIKYKMNNYKQSHENMDDLLKKVKDIQWNSKTGKYKDQFKYFSKGFLDTAFFYTDSIRQNITNSNALQTYNKISYYLRNNDIQYSVNRLKEKLQEGVQDTNAVFTYYLKSWDLETHKSRITKLKTVKLNTITVDSFYKWSILSYLDTIDCSFNNEAMVSYDNKGIYEKLNTDKFGYYIYKSYRDSLMTEQDSMMLDRIFTQTGYLQEKEEHSRLFFHTHSYYLFYGDMIVNKSRAFLTGWNVFYLSTMVKLAMITLTLLFFFTTLAKSNLFVSLFIAFFINFSLNLFLNVGQKFQIADQSKQSWILFLLLFGLICWTTFSLLFRKFKQAFIFQIINIQLLTVLGLLLGVFDAQLLLSILNYLYLYLAFWFILALRFRNYLALQIK